MPIIWHVVFSPYPLEDHQDLFKCFTLANKLLEDLSLGRYQHHIVDCVSWSKMLHGVLRTKSCCNWFEEIANSTNELGKQWLVELPIELLEYTQQDLLLMYSRLGHALDLQLNAATLVTTKRIDSFLISWRDRIVEPARFVWFHAMFDLPRQVGFAVEISISTCEISLIY